MVGGEDSEVMMYPIGKDSLISSVTELSEEEKLNKRIMWSRKMNDIKYVVAPMVDQSELAFRMMMRKHGAHLCYSPMIHAHLFVHDMTYRKSVLLSCKGDRPLIVQFCANDPDVLLKACCLVEGTCDGVDLNLGCPQLIAKHGHYGAYLQDDQELVCSMVAAVNNRCHLPLSCKIRIFDDADSTVEYARKLVNAGACMLTVHGRTREQRGPHTGVANWEIIKRVCAAVDVPVIANGNIQIWENIDDCIKKTGAVAVMSAEGVLSNPYLYENKRLPNWIVAQEYLSYAEKYKANISAIRAHLFRICHYSLLIYPELRQQLSYVCSMSEFSDVVCAIDPQFSDAGKIDYIMSLPHWICKPYLRPQRDDSVASTSEYRERRRQELDLIVRETGLSKRQIRKREKRKTQSRKQTYPKCHRCSMPASQGCDFSYCRNCCRYKTAHERLDCKGFVVSIICTVTSEDS
uniref:tRNA-dihydrouridine(16/17) synthase [NAD(P)(+)] n=1 Tax=Syphacia muris TaxID=451379 RepID=A0A0N5AWS6_9BILA